MKKQKTDGQSWQKKNTFIPKIASLLLVCVLASLVIVSFAAVIKKLEYFKVKDVLSRTQDIQRLTYLKGKNIFGINLQNEAVQIALREPGYKKVVLVRVLPDRLFVDLLKRQPFACIKLSKIYFVDQEGVLLGVKDDGAEDGQLPLITGLERKINRVEIGARYNVPELSLALDLIRKFNQSHGFKNVELKEARVYELKEASLVLFDGLVVKIGQNNISYKLSLLTNLLKQSSEDLPNIEYIDLRFKDPVIKLKEQKLKPKR